MEDNIQQQQKGSKFWHVHYDRLYRKHGVYREYYNKRKFTGGRLKEIKNLAPAIFSDVKMLLRKHKDTGAEDIEID